MKCISCGAEIPPSFVHAIQTNICAGCGGAIMDDASKEILTNLKEAMEKMPNDTEGLAGWIMSTYDLFPKGTVTPTTFHRKSVPGSELASVAGNVRWANSPTHDFMKRAGADKILRDPKLAAAAQFVNNVESADSTMYGDQEIDVSEAELDAEEQSLLMQQQIKTAALKAKVTGKRPTVRDVLANNTIFNFDEEAGPPLSYEETMMMKELVGGKDSSELEDLASLPPALQADRLKRLAKQRDLIHGGSIGIVKRSEG